MKYNTIAHIVLDLEQDLGTTVKDYDVLDDIIDSSIKMLEIKEQYDSKTVKNNLSKIDLNLNINWGFRYVPTINLNDSLKSKNANCVTYTLLYLAIIEIANMPIVPLAMDKHITIRYKGKKNFNWEVTHGEIYSNNDYKEYGKLKEFNYNELIAEIYNILGLKFAELGNSDKSLIKFNKALEKNPLDDIYYINRGINKQLLNNLKGSLDDFDKAFILNNKNHLALFNKSVILSDLKKYDDALITINKALKLKNNDASAYFNKSIYLYYLDKNQEAFECLKKAYYFLSEEDKIYLKQMSNFEDILHQEIKKKNI